MQFAQRRDIGVHVSPVDALQADDAEARPAATADLRVPLAATVAGRTPARPNVVMITTDDMSVDELAHLPQVRRLLVERGTTFTSAIAPSPLCVPARASLLTGQYAHPHGARATEGPLGGVGGAAPDPAGRAQPGGGEGGEGDRDKDSGELHDSRRCSAVD